jgi:hypothetical protein
MNTPVLPMLKQREHLILGTAMRQIADWLKQLGMQEYIQRFAENDIDFAILGEPTDQDLEKIGVTSLGHRRKLLRAIADLHGVEKGTPTVAVVAGPTTAPHCRAPSGHSAVLGPSRLYGTFRPHGPGRSARGYFGLSKMHR